MTNIRSLYAGSPGTTPVFGGNLGFKTYAHSFLASVDRTLGQTYGVGAADTITANAAWHWSLPGRNWSVTSSYMRQQSRGGVFGNIDGWLGSFGVSRRMGPHVMMQTAYTYAAYSSNSRTFPYSRNQNAVRVTLIWFPQDQGR